MGSGRELTAISLAGGSCSFRLVFQVGDGVAQSRANDRASAKEFSLRGNSKCLVTLSDPAGSFFWVGEGVRTLVRTYRPSISPKYVFLLRFRPLHLESTQNKSSHKIIINRNHGGKSRQNIGELSRFFWVEGHRYIGCDSGWPPLSVDSSL